MIDIRASVQFDEQPAILAGIQLLDKATIEQIELAIDAASRCVKERLRETELSDGLPANYCPGDRTL